METFLLFVIICMLFGVGSKLDDLKKEGAERKRRRGRLEPSTIRKFLGKEVSLTIDQPEIAEEYLFSSYSDTQGVILEVGDEWLSFKYETRCFCIKRRAF